MTEGEIRDRDEMARAAHCLLERALLLCAALRTNDEPTVRREVAQVESHASALARYLASEEPSS